MTMANECNVRARFATEPQRPVRKHVAVKFTRACLCRHYFATKSCDVQWTMSARVAITECRCVRMGTNLNAALLRFPCATARAPRDTLHSDERMSTRISPTVNGNNVRIAASFSKKRVLASRLPNTSSHRQLAAWSGGMIVALGVRGPGINSQSSPVHTCVTSLRC